MFKDNSTSISARIDSLQHEISELRRHRLAAPPPPQHQQHRLPRETIVRGISTTTRAGSLYSTTIKALARLGHLDLQDSLFEKFRRERTATSAHRLLQQISVPRDEMEAAVRADEKFQEHSKNRTVQYKTLAAKGNKKYQGILKNRKICDGKGRWHGDFDEMVFILSGARDIQQVKRGKNIQILNKAGLMFDTFMVGEEQYCVLYAQKWHRQFKRAVALVNS